MRRWVEPAPVVVPDDLRDLVDGAPLLAQILARRGITTPQAAAAFLNPDAYTPSPPADLPDMARAAERVRRAVAAGEHICVWGDFDVDGQTATALLVAALRGLGADPAYYIPDREREGHGLHSAALAARIDAGARLIITCDTGVTAHRAVEYARARGVDIVITDHHNLPAALPDACAVVNPKRLPVDHPLRELPGVGCAYKLVEQLYEGRRTADFLDLVALGIVADVATQTGDTRYLLQRGLEALRATARPGLLKVMELAGIRPAEITEQQIGFALGPRLNALGRLGDANEAVVLLTSTDPVEVEVLARRLEGLNNQRRFETEQVYNAALRMVEGDRSLLEHAALVLSHAQWPGGVIGIAASRLAERFNRPVVLITTGSPGGAGRGSARSVAGCDITAALAEHADMLSSYGGHSMAAGLTIAEENIAGFRQALGYTVRRMRGDAPPAAALTVDAYVALGDLSLAFADQLGRLAPFGPGNPPVTLATRGLETRSRRALGRGGDHLRVVVADENRVEREVIWWGGAEGEFPNGRFDLAYSVRVSRFSGEPEVLLEWIDARETGAKAAEVVTAAAAAVAGDYRQSDSLLADLAELRAREPGLVVWREADDQVDGLTRAQLAPAPALAVWTIPPGPDVWRMALERAQPARIYLLGADPGVDAPGAFIGRLAGLAKATLRRGAPVSAADLAAAMAHNEAAVRAGLRLLAAEGYLTVREQRDGLLSLSASGAPDDAELVKARRELEWLLKEAATYRRYWRGAQQLPGLSRIYP